MSLLEQLRSEATRRRLLPPSPADPVPLEVAEVFRLVRDMPYRRSSSADPETIIREWRGTCSSKHYLLKALFAELGLTSRLMACPARLTLEEAAGMPHLVQGLLAEGDFVDVHNYLVLDTPGGEMKVDATWPARVSELGFPVNEFEWGRDMDIGVPPLARYEVPEVGSPNEFKTWLLGKYFTPSELQHRERVIATISELLSSA